MLDLTVNILEKFIVRLEMKGKIIAIQRASDSTKILVDKTYHARKEMQLDVDGVIYEILDVVFNESITVKGVVKSAVNYIVPVPKYFHGTPIMTNAHINGAAEGDKLPMIYLYEIIKERDKREESNIVRESDLRLFFLDNADFSDWDTDEHYSKRLLGLNSLVDFFIKKARKNTCEFYLFKTDFTRINHVNWGMFVNNQGHKKRLFDEELTGVELSFTLPLKLCSQRMISK